MEFTPARRRLLTAILQLDAATAQAGDRNAPMPKLLRNSPRDPSAGQGRRQDLATVQRPDVSLCLHGVNPGNVSTPGKRQRSSAALDGRGNLLGNHQNLPKPACMMCDGRSGSLSAAAVRFSASYRACAARPSASVSDEIVPSMTHSRAAFGPSVTTACSSMSSNLEIGPGSDCPETSRETVACVTRSQTAN